MTRTSYQSNASDTGWSLVAPYLTLMTADAPQRDYSLCKVFNNKFRALLVSCGIVPLVPALDKNKVATHQDKRKLRRYRHR